MLSNVLIVGELSRGGEGEDFKLTFFWMEMMA